jgi:hypothetical protein
MTAISATAASRNFLAISRFGASPVGETILIGSF